MIITISGKPGSGKSTVGRLLAKKLGYRFFSAGDLRGRIAMERGLTIDQLNEIGKTEKWTDEECDKLLEKMGKTENDLVFDSRLAWHFVPNSFKIFLDVDLKEAAKRIFSSIRSDEARHNSVDEMLDAITKRMNSDDERYKKWYGLSYLDLTHYDLVIDTTQLTPDKTVTKIMQELKKRQK